MNISQNSAGSLGYYNLARGIGMVMVLWFHSATAFAFYEPHPWSLFSGAGSVVGGGIMAMFFMMSGDGFYKRSPKKCFSIQKKNLLYPYFITAAAVLLTKLILAVAERRSFWDHGGEYLPTYLLGLNAEGGGELWGIPIQSVSIFWFVLALFGGWNIYNAIVQNKAPMRQHILSALCVVLSWLLILISPVWPFCLPQMLLVVGYLHVGVCIRQNNLLEKPLRWWQWCLLLSVALLCAAFGEVNIVRSLFRLGLLDMIGSFCWSFLLLRLYAVVMRRLKGNALVSLLETVGFYSLWVVCLHAYEKVIVPWYWLGFLLPESPLLCTLICLVCRSLLLLGLYHMISTCHQKWKGRKRKPKIVIE